MKRPDAKREPAAQVARAQTTEAKTIAAAERPVNVGPPVVEKKAPAGTGNDNALLLERELTNAREQIEQELASARKHIELEAAALRAAAEREGFAKGMEMAEQAARQAVAEQIERIDSIMEALSQARVDLVEGAEDMMVEIVYAAVCRIIGEAAPTRAGVSGMVDQVLASFKERDKLVVRLNPQDFELLQQVSEVPRGREAALRADTSIMLGGCIVESSNGFLDAKIETQLTRFGEALLVARRKREDLGEAL